MESFIYIILLCGAVQGLFLSLVLGLRKHGNMTANRIISLFLLLFSVSIALHALGHKGYLEFLPEHDLLITVLIFAYNPLLYLYTIIQTGKKERFSPAVALHFIPVILFSFFVSYAYFVSRGRINHLFKIDMNLLENVMSGFLIPQYIAYFALTIRGIYVYTKLVQNSYPGIRSEKLRWIALLLGINTVTWIVAALVSIILPENNQSWDYVWLFVSAYMYLIGYFSLNQEQPAAVEYGLISGKYQSSNLRPEKAAEIYENLQKSMNQDKAYLTEELTLSALSQDIGCTAHHLSQVINDKFSMNFSEYINRQRIDEAKHILLDKNSQMTVADIAFHVGFNSLSAFNSAFKKFTSKTPTNFKNNQ